MMEQESSGSLDWVCISFVSLTSEDARGGWISPCRAEVRAQKKQKGSHDHIHLGKPTFEDLDDADDRRAERFDLVVRVQAAAAVRVLVMTVVLWCGGSSDNVVDEADGRGVHTPVGCRSESG